MMTTDRHTGHGQLGFSLNEALVSLTLLSSGLFTLAQFQGQIQEQSADTKAQTTAVNLARQKLEELRHQAIGDYAGLADGSDTPATNPGDTSRFQRRWTLVPHHDPDYSEVEVTTNWQSIDGSGQAASIRSFVSAGTPYVSRRWTMADAEESAPASEESTATPPTDSTEQAAAAAEQGQETAPAKVVTCLCQSDGGGARLDPRNGNGDCSSDCCQGSASGETAGICQDDGCTFVAQCRVAT